MLCLLIGCGRIGIDPIGDPSGDGGGSATDDGGGSASGDASIDAPPTACAFAVTLQPFTPLNINTCTGRDQVDGCGGANTEEVVFKFTVPTTGSYSFRARDPGTQNVSNSTAMLNAACTAIGPCAGVLASSFNAGQVLYLIVEANAAGGCAQIEFENY